MNIKFNEKPESVKHQSSWNRMETQRILSDKIATLIDMIDNSKFPEITGKSEKQIEYGKKCRKQTIAVIRDEIEKFGVGEGLINDYDIMLTNLINSVDAGFWIDNAFDSLTTPITEREKAVQFHFPSYKFMDLFAE